MFVNTASHNGVH